MRTFEVRFPLESGFTLNVVVAAHGEADARREAHKVLLTACEPKAEGDCMRICWRFDEVTAREVEINDLIPA